MWSKIIIVILLVGLISCKVVVLSGGDLSINGAITDSYYDLYVNYTSSMNWLAIIWSQN